MNILDSFEAFFFVFILLVSEDVLCKPDPVRILPDQDPGWFSKSMTSMVRLTPNV